MASLRFVAALMTTVIAVAAHAEVLDDLFILSDIDRGEIEIRLWPGEGQADTLLGATADLRIECPDGTTQELTAVDIDPSDDGAFCSLTVDIDPVILWHPRTPNLYQLWLTLRDADGNEIASRAERFGMRRIERRGDRFFVNNHPFFARLCAGEGGCGSDDLTREEMEQRLRAMRRYGFNAVRHHSHVPTDLYMDVADEVGIFVQMEIHGRIGTDPESEQFLESREAWTNMVRRGRRHPSTFIYSVGNEIYRNDPGLIVCQDLLFDLTREMDPSVLFLNRSGSNPFNDAHGQFDLIERPIGEYEHVGPFAREALELYLRGDRMGRSDEFPIIAHEYPLVASFPNPELAHLYDEVPEWMATAIEQLHANGQDHLIPTYVENSERIQAICRREMLEEARKFPELDGYSMLRFTDCGDYVSGVVNDFAEPKNVTAEEFLRTNGETVLLCSWNERCLEFGDVLELTIEISHHGPDTFTAEECALWLLDGPDILASTSFEDVSVDPVDVAEVGQFSVVIPELPGPRMLTIRALLPGTDPLILNEWNVWAFPGTHVDEGTQTQITLWDPRDRMGTYLNVYDEIERVTDPDWTPTISDPGLIITDSWQDAFYDHLAEGGNIWVISDKSWPWPEEVGIFGIHITHFVDSRQAPVVFPELDEHCNTWMTICSNNRNRHGNSGTVISNHPAMGDFPHEGFCDLQFWPMVYRAKSLQLDRFPVGTEPIIRTIDNYYRCQNKGYMVDIESGTGHVFVSTLNLTQSFERSPATRHMFDQILRYVTGDERVPSVTMTPEELQIMIGEFAEEIATREPLIHDMRPARYETRWRWLMSPTELLLIPIADAEGIDDSRLGVHYEYAQTQWYFDARPGDALTLTFENETTGDFTGTLNLASPLEGVAVEVAVDGGDIQTVALDPPDAWNHFTPVDFTISALATGEHTLTLTLPDSLAVSDGRTVQIRDVEMRGSDPRD